MMRAIIIVTSWLLLWAGPGLADPGTATYTVTLDATWSAETHPNGFPSNPHFSGLIGGSHDSTVRFWELGQLATTGIRQMAEWGSKQTLTQEVETAIAGGGAGAVISGGGIGTSPGQVSQSFSVAPEFPLVTLVAMIAPSPDWFVGVAGVNLLAGGSWQAEVVVTLFPVDAGTDSGTNYNSFDQVTNPPQPISLITGAPFAPGVPIGTLTFRLDAVSAVEVPLVTASLSASPNPFNPRTELRYEVAPNARVVRLEIFDARGRRIRQLPAKQAPGVHTTSWDGTDGRGVRLGSGLYLARLVVDQQVQVQKITLLP